LKEEGKQYLHISLIKFVDEEGSLKTPLKLINFYDILRIDWRVSSGIYLEKIDLII
jgi:hypothetical protein